MGGACAWGSLLLQGLEVFFFFLKGGAKGIGAISVEFVGQKCLLKVVVGGASGAGAGLLGLRWPSLHVDTAAGDFGVPEHFSDWGVFAGIMVGVDEGSLHCRRI